MSAISRKMSNHFISSGVFLAAGLVVTIYLFILFEIFHHGFSALSFNFIFENPSNAGRSGGIAPILYSTLLVLGISLSVAIPIGLGCAILISEFNFNKESTAFGKVVRYSLDLLAGMPSIVFGLCGNAVFSKIFGLGFSILSGGLTLACMILPLFIRTSEEALRLVPQKHRISGVASGLRDINVVFKIVLPLALPGIIVGLILSTGRALAETAALIFTSGYVDRWPESITDSGRVLSVHILDLAMNVPGGNTNAYKSALVLVGLILIINSLAKWISKKWQQKVLKTI